MRGGGQTHLREHNRAAVLRTLLDHGPLSRTQLSRLVRLTPPALSYLAAALLADRLVIEVRSPTAAPRARGGQAVPLDLAPHGRSAVAIHIGATGLSVGLVNLRAQVQTHATRRLDLETWGPDPRRLADEVAGTLAGLQEATGVGRAALLGVGAGIAGWVDSERGVVIRHRTLGWKDVALARALEDALHLPVLIQEQVRGMALAESWFGHARTVESLALIYVGAIVGSASVVDRRVHRGSQAAAGAVGGLPAFPGAPSLEALVSEPAIYQQARQLVTRRPDTVATRWLAGGRGDSVPFSSDLANLLSAAPAADPAWELLRSRARHLAPFVAHLVGTTDPEALVVGGPLVWDDAGVQLRLLREAVLAHAPVLAERLPPFLPFSFREPGNLVGAAAPVLQAVFSPPLSGLPVHHAGEEVRRRAARAK